ncbi:outer membrane protein, OmpA/MotB, C-terminal [Formosa agariphila KMM 3901]|uniref:Outer membrane protein, OmpA/MotB, C-terminal n=1 Tax=Formosa agariphila (strain DSM 15362 / KCTC 12365 / LMG 23005 / KMM 3901 / M-2Alg 35-1) TaxID=1347342 RepID=T2KHA6_FORAG|nr:OmpA family protein [Formosa agariphila]CDF77781.1 outer membrane protein, OmpA/MotB, C-terminal [Formosa agariphila KMM 3901]
MKKITFLYSVLWFCLTLAVVIPANGQEKKLIQASQNYDQLDYVNAQKIYLSVAQNGYKSEELYTKLANSYYFNAQYDQAVKWYDELFLMVEKPKENIIYLRYSQALKAIGQKDKAMEFYNLFVSDSQYNETSLLAEDYLNLITQNSGRYDLNPIRDLYDKNKISFGHEKIGDTLFFASTKDSKAILKKKSAWDGLSFLSLYEVELDSLNQVVGNPKMLKGKLNGKFHESSPVFTPDNKTMFLTRSNINIDDATGEYKLKIYKSVKLNDKWQEAEELSFNHDDFSTAHPALNSDGTKLYFSSDRPGGYGSSDIYVSTINKQGAVGEPVNLGPEINTAGKETFPFVTTLNELYFSSDGHFGLGGLDIFYVKIVDDHYGNLLNIGEPLNSNADDFAFGIDLHNNRGFISSNRSTKEGEFVYDNIYTFKEKAPIKDVFYSDISGYVTDRQSKRPIEGARISLRNADGETLQEVETNALGFYEIETKKFQSYFIKSEKDRYDTDERLIQTEVDHQEINFQLQQNIVDLTPGMNLAEVLNIPIIYFDYDKSNIREDAEVELQKILITLNEYPALKLEIRSHTDSRGSDAYNMKLSSSRAQSTLDYLVINGIDKNRLTAKGFGESRLVNKCSNGVECTESEHEDNRRSEFIIID